MKIIHFGWIVLWASALPCASAQVATFDLFSEGPLPATFTDGGITFSNLDNNLGGIVGTIPFTCEQANGDLAGYAEFSSPNCLGASGVTMGPPAGYGRTLSYEMTTGQIATEGRLELWDACLHPGNTITLEARLNGNLVNAHTIVSGPGFAVHHTLLVSGVAFDMLRLQGGGSQDNGVFFALVDNVQIGSTPPATVTCPGDGSGAPCPCGNNSAVGAGIGCLSSLGVGGSLRVTGTTSLSADTAVLHGTQMPNAPCLYFQGTTQLGGGAGAAFGDGLRCAGGTIVRIGTKMNAGGASQYPAAGDPALSVRGQVSPGLRVYQAWYRNAAAFCTISTFNLTNSIAVTWF